MVSAIVSALHLLALALGLPSVYLRGRALKVRLDGEVWAARSTRGAAEHDSVRIVGRDRLTLIVEPVSEPTDHPGSSHRDDEPTSR